MGSIFENFKKFVKRNKIVVICSLIIVFGLYYLLFSSQKGRVVEEIEFVSYPQFLEYLEAGMVDKIEYSKQNNYMYFMLFNEDTKEMTMAELEEYNYGISDTKCTFYPGYDDFRREMLGKGLRMEQNLTSQTSVLDLITTIISALITVVFFSFLFSIFRSQTRGLDKKDLIQTSNVRFNDIIGHDEILEDLQFITELIRNPCLGDKVGAKSPKGLLLAGPPGTGKTLIAKAIAHEAGVPFLYQNASGFIEMYVGLGAKRVRELFKIARENAPCIIFIDEIDAIGGKRGETKGTSEHDQTINAILQEMDGFSGREGVFIIAATNRPESLDSALVRSGRFDRQITVNPPRDWTVRKKLFEHYLNKFSVSDSIDIDSLSKQTSGFTGADIAMVCNEASIVAVMKNKRAIDRECLEEAIDKKVFKGNRAKDRDTFKSDKTIVAYHESGHAVMSYLLGEPIARASILATISGVGGAVFNEDKESLFRTDADFKNKVLICYGGRISEEIKFGQVTTGASNDITQATQSMLHYIEKYGFDKDFGLLDISVLNKEHLIDGDQITEKLSTMSKELYQEGMNLLRQNYDKVERLAQKLLEVETLNGEEITVLLEN